MGYVILIESFPDTQALLAINHVRRKLEQLGVSVSVHVPRLGVDPRLEAHSLQAEICRTPTAVQLCTGLFPRHAVSKRPQLSGYYESTSDPYFPSLVLLLTPVYDYSSFVVQAPHTTVIAYSGPRDLHLLTAEVVSRVQPVVRVRNSWV